MKHLHSITRYPAAEPSKRAEMDIEDIETEQIDRLELCYYFGWDDEVAVIEARLEALDALRATYDEDYKPRTRRFPFVGLGVTVEDRQ